MSEDLAHVNISSIYGHNTKKALVVLDIGGEVYQWEAADARRVGLMLLDAAATSETDAFICRWLRDVIGIVDDSQVAQVLAEFRSVRSREPSPLAKTFPAILEDM